MCGRFLFVFTLFFFSVLITGNQIISRDHFMPGGKSRPVDFSLVDTSGKPVSLSSFRGKFVVISMMAGWCGPCIQEVSAIKGMQRDFADKDIVWIFVSFDRDMRDWKSSIHKDGLSGVHLWGKPESNNLKKLFDFNSIPYFIWIDQEGEIAMSGAPRPSTSAATKQLKYYLK